MAALDVCRGRERRRFALPRSFFEALATCSTSSTSVRSPKIRGQKPQSFAEANDTPFAMLSGRRPAKRGGYQAAIGVEIHMARAPSCGSSLTLARGHNCGSLDDQSSKIGKM